MARATYSEHWHRIRDLTPRIRSGVTVRTVWYRGERWHVVGDPVSGRFHRLTAGAYAMVGRLDGRRTIDEACAVAMRVAGDAAPTQGEAIAILGHLWASGILGIEATPDVRALLQRAAKGRRREVGAGALMALFPRIPLVDPDRFLAWLTGWMGWAYSRWGVAVWAVVVGLGIASIAGQWRRAADRIDGLLEPAGAVWAIVAYIIAKLIHECGHGVACKAMARREGIRARVPTMGVMILLGVPSPYVDASAAWGLRSKWRRAAVGAAGMHAELALAAIAAIVWSRVGEGPLAEWAFSTMIVAGISTVLFNANPLLRYDGYYILSDLAEIPNLARRATDQLWHIASRHAWGLRSSVTPARDRAEAALLVVYAVVAAAYRFALAWTITAIVWNRLPVVGALVGLVAFATLVAAPVAMAVRRIVAGDALRPVRRRAVATTALALAVGLVLVGLVPAPHTVTAVGVVEASARADVHADAPGALASIAPSGSVVRAGVSALARFENPDAIAERKQWEAMAERVELERQRSLVRSVAEARAWESRAEAAEARLREARRIEDALTVVAPIDGVWIAVRDAGDAGRWITRGSLLGAVTSAGGTRIRVPVREPQAAAIVRHTDGEPLAARARSASGRGGVCRGSVARVAQAADSRHGFEATIDLIDGNLHAGERVITRIELPPSPLLPRWIDAVRRTVLERDLGAREPPHPAP